MPAATSTFVPFSVIPALVELTKVVFTFSGKTALQSKRSLVNTLVNEIPPVYPLTGVPASSLEIIKLVTINLVSQEDSLPQASLTVNVIVVVPDKASVPAAGDCVICKDSFTEQLSVATMFFV